MRLTQELLRDQAARRIRAARPDLAVRLDLSTTANLLAAQAEITSHEQATETVVVSVIRRFDRASWIRGTCAFVAGLSPERVPAWRRSFTRTLFLAGNPENLRHRFAFEHVSEDHSVAWTAPATAETLIPLRRLLKLFDGPHGLPPQPTLTVEVPGVTGRRSRVPLRHELYLATVGVTVADSLVSLNHLLAEAVLDGLIAPGDRLTVRQVPRLVGVSQPFEALRVDVDPANPDLLRAYVGLTKESYHG